jgi:hypothetical protein
MHDFNLKATTGREFCEGWLKAMGGIIPLTNKELIVLTEFLTLYLERTGPIPDLFKTKNRQAVRAHLGLTTQNINNYINFLKNKKLIYIRDGESGINKMLIPNVKKVEEGMGVSININIIRVPNSEGSQTNT